MSNLKIVLATLFTTAVLFLIFMGPNKDFPESPDESSSPTKPSPIAATAEDSRANKITALKDEQRRKLAQQLLPKRPTSVGLSEGELTELKLASEEKKKQIEQLMTQYDLHRGQDDKRADIKAQIKSLMDEYNQLILPLAMTEMASASKG